MEISNTPRKSFLKRVKVPRKDTAKKAKEVREKARKCWGVVPYAGLHPYYITNATRHSGKPASALLIQGLDRADNLMNAEGKGAKSALKAVLAYVQLIGERKSRKSTKDCIKPFRQALNEMGEAAAEGRDVDKMKLESVLQAMRDEASFVQQRFEVVQGGLSHRGML